MEDSPKYLLRFKAVCNSAFFANFQQKNVFLIGIDENFVGSLKIYEWLQVEILVIMESLEFQRLSL